MKKKEIKFGVYWIRNKVNGKVDVGSTGWTQGFKARWKIHIRELNSKKTIHHSCYCRSCYLSGRIYLQFSH